jgi:putative redox protein
LSDIVITLTGPHSTHIVHPNGAVIDTAMAKEYGGPGGTFSSTDLVAAALGSCIATNIGPLAHRHGVDLASIRLAARKTLGGEPRRISRLEVDITIDAPVPAELQPAIRRAAESCTVHRSLSHDTETRINIQFAV